MVGITFEICGLIKLVNGGLKKGSEAKNTSTDTLV